MQSMQRPDYSLRSRKVDGRRVSTRKTKGLQPSKYKMEDVKRVESTVKVPKMTCRVPKTPVKRPYRHRKSLAIQTTPKIPPREPLSKDPNKKNRTLSKPPIRRIVFSIGGRRPGIEPKELVPENSEPSLHIFSPTSSISYMERTESIQAEPLPHVVYRPPEPNVNLTESTKIQVSALYEKLKSTKTIALQVFPKKKHQARLNEYLFQAGRDLFDDKGRKEIINILHRDALEQNSLEPRVIEIGPADIHKYVQEGTFLVLHYRYKQRLKEDTGNYVTLPELVPTNSIFSGSDVQFVFNFKKAKASDIDVEHGKEKKLNSDIAQTGGNDLPIENGCKDSPAVANMHVCEAVDGMDAAGIDVDVSNGSPYVYGTLHADGRKYYYSSSAGTKAASANPECSDNGEDTSVCNLSATSSLKTKKSIMLLKGSPIIPQKLLEAVQNYGGIEVVRNKRLWQQVRTSLNLEPMSSSGCQLNKAYEHYFGNIAEMKNKHWRDLKCTEKNIQPPISIDRTASMDKVKAHPGYVCKIRAEMMLSKDLHGTISDTLRAEFLFLMHRVEETVFQDLNLHSQPPKRWRFVKSRDAVRHALYTVDKIIPTSDRFIVKRRYFFKTPPCKYNVSKYKDDLGRFPVGITTYKHIYSPSELRILESKIDSTLVEIEKGKMMPETYHQTRKGGHLTRTKMFFNARYLWTKEQTQNKILSSRANGIRVDVEKGKKWLLEKLEKPLIKSSIIEEDFVNSYACNVYHDGSDGLGPHFDDLDRFAQPIVSLRLFSDCRLCFDSKGWIGLDSSFFIPMQVGDVTIMEKGLYAVTDVKHSVRAADMTGKSAVLLLRHIHSKLLQAAWDIRVDECSRIIDSMNLSEDPWKVSGVRLPAPSFLEAKRKRNMSIYEMVLDDSIIEETVRTTLNECIQKIDMRLRIAPSFELLSLVGKIQKKRISAMDCRRKKKSLVGYECVYQCGFQGSFVAVAKHEKVSHKDEAIPVIVQQRTSQRFKRNQNLKVTVKSCISRMVEHAVGSKPYRFVKNTKPRSSNPKKRTLAMSLTEEMGVITVYGDSAGIELQENGKGGAEFVRWLTPQSKETAEVTKYDVCRGDCIVGVGNETHLERKSGVGIPLSDVIQLMQAPRPLQLFFQTTVQSCMFRMVRHVAGLEQYSLSQAGQKPTIKSIKRKLNKLQRCKRNQNLKVTVKSCISRMVEHAVGSKPYRFVKNTKPRSSNPKKRTLAMSLTEEMGVITVYGDSAGIELQENGKGGAEFVRWLTPQSKGNGRGDEVRCLPWGLHCWSRQRDASRKEEWGWHTSFRCNPVDASPPPPSTVFFCAENLH